MPPEYHYNDHLRWTYFWENPNYAAAFLACSLGWLWWLESACKEKTGQHAGFIAALVLLGAIELAVWFLLAKTYSRGGLLAAVAGMLFFFGLRGTGSLPVRFGWHGRLARVLSSLAIRLALIAAICTAVGFSSRISPAYAMRDNSVLNRLEFWRGALVMMSDSPFHGWGRGMGGMAYIDWYQPLEATTRPTGFVNSYLEVAVEQGTHVLFVALTCALALILIAARQRKRHVWALAGGSVLVAWLAANLLSSLWADPVLWILPAIAAVCIIASAVRSHVAQAAEPAKVEAASRRFFESGKMPLPSCTQAAVASLLICALLLLAGVALSKNYPCRAKPLAQSDAVLVTSRGNENAGQPLCELWVDGAVFGPFWGKTLRPMLGESTASSLLVYAPWAQKAVVQLDKAPLVSVYSGFQVGAINNNRNAAGKTILLHPSGFPAAAAAILPATTIVCLPAVDTSSYGLPWRIWADKHADRMLYSPQGGVLIAPSANLPFWCSLLSTGKPGLQSGSARLLPRKNLPRNLAPANSRDTRGGNSMNAILANLGNIGMNGLPSLSFNLVAHTDAAEIRRLGFALKLQHKVNLASGRTAISGWRIPALITAVYLDGQDDLSWLQPGGQIERFSKTDSGVYKDSDGSIATVSPDGNEIEIVTAQAQTWRYKDGFAESVKAYGHKYNFTTNRETILAISRTGIAKPLLEITYSDAGQLSEMVFADGKKCSFQWTHDNCLKCVNGDAGTQVDFEYDNMLLKSWRTDDGPVRELVWLPMETTRRLAFGMPPVLLGEDSLYIYRWSMSTREGVKILDVFSKSGALLSQTRIGSTGIEQQTPHGAYHHTFKKQ